MLCSESFAPKALAISPPVLAQRRGAVGDLLGFGPVAIHFGGQALDLLGSRRSRGVELRHGSVRASGGSVPRRKSEPGEYQGIHLITLFCSFGFAGRFAVFCSVDHSLS